MPSVSDTSVLYVSLSRFARGPLFSRAVILLFVLVLGVVPRALFVWFPSLLARLVGPGLPNPDTGPRSTGCPLMDAGGAILSNGIQHYGQPLSLFGA